MCELTCALECNLIRTFDYVRPSLSLSLPLSLLFFFSLFLAVWLSVLISVLNTPLTYWNCCRFYKIIKKILAKFISRRDTKHLIVLLWIYFLHTLDLYMISLIFATLIHFSKNKIYFRDQENHTFDFKICMIAFGSERALRLSFLLLQSFHLQIEETPYLSWSTYTFINECEPIRDENDMVFDSKKMRIIQWKSYCRISWEACYFMKKKRKEIIFILPIQTNICKWMW